jgi:hypothetical protein
MITEQYKPDSNVEEVREVRIDIPRIGPQRKTVEIIGGMAVTEGDIVLGKAENFTDLEAAGAPEYVVDSIAQSGADALWPDGVVPYEIASDMSNTSRVHDAIDHWEANTPIEFVQRSTQDDYVRFFEGGGCWSYVGRQGGRQRISLAPGCGTGAAIHEIAHAIGVWHEQSRSDRDVYIDINWDNIRESAKSNFKAHEESNDIGRYDYGSIMHYPPYAFSTGGKTIEAPEPIGQRRGLSEGDIDAVFRLYAPTDADSTVSVTDDWQHISFDSDVDPDPVVLTGVQTFNGGNTIGVRMRNPSGGDAEVFLEEEKSSDSETSHIAEELGFFATDEGTMVDETASPIGEAGVVTTDQAGPGEWHTVALDNAYSNPVVFMQLMSYNGRHPAHTRVRDVRSNSFKFQIEEWDYLDRAHTTEDIGYVVLEEGTHRMRNGLELTVGNVETDHTWTTVSHGVKNNPVVISQCQTFNGSHEVVTRLRDVDKRSFDVRLQEEEARDGRHTTETTGYLAISRPETFEFGIARDDATHEWRQLDYESDFESTPATIASISTYNGGNTAGVRLKNPGSREIQLQLEEEKSADDETTHIEEEVAYLATPEGTVYYGTGKQLGEAGVGTWNQASDSEWHSIDLDRDYQSGEPVAFTQLLSKNGSQPAHTRVRNVGPDSFEFQIEEWEYLNGHHISEQIGYLVLPTGLYPLPDGGLLEVGTTRTNHSWTSVSLDSRLPDGDGNLTVVSRCQTYNGPQAVVTRQRNVSPSGFDVRLQEEEARGEHRTETIGYAAAIHRE